MNICTLLFSVRFARLKALACVCAWPHRVMDDGDRGGGAPPHPTPQPPSLTSHTTKHRRLGGFAVVEVARDVTSSGGEKGGGESKGVLVKEKEGPDA